ncbi:MAG: cellulase family glycosylhydrolase [Bryobacter sp.]|nr:cellulase family glycosylhydrolase [Bryobacter sp.]
MATTMRRRTALAALSLAACSAPPPRLWQGFNLLEKFTHDPAEWQSIEPAFARRNEPFREQDFDLIAALGFNYVRLPLSYRCWADPARPLAFAEAPLREIEQAVTWARARRLHITLNFHRAPGYCINQANSPEPWDLWTDPAAQELFVKHWLHFTERFRHLPGETLSFHLVNEPSRCTVAQYQALMERTAGAIHAIDPQRTLLFDGMFGEAILPVEALTLVPRAVHVTRGYAPFRLTHHQAKWGGEVLDTPPAWPMSYNGTTWNDEVYRTWCIEPYAKLSRAGHRVLVGEFGCYNKTPHAVMLAWMKRRLREWQAEGWGWALWNLRGPFGIFESNRADVRYERYQGLALDRILLELLQSFSARSR